MRAARLLPGLLLCAAVGGAATAFHFAQVRVLGRAWLDSLVLAVLIGAAVRLIWEPGRPWAPGVAFGATIPLEVAVVLLGASLDGRALSAFGAAALGGIAAVVALGMAAGYGIGRLFGLDPRLALLIACGNSICGNSAIVAAAPVIGADARHVAASIAFSAGLGVLVVLGLPVLQPLIPLSGAQYGMLAGMTVYAVPQVVAATAAAGALSLQIGTLAKPARVLMLGPVLVALALGAALLKPGGGRGRRPPGRFPPARQVVPWFVLGFLGAAALRSSGWLPEAALQPLSAAASGLTLLAMSGLGLGADLRAAARAGGRVAGAAAVSLAVLGAASGGLILALGVS